MYLAVAFGWNSDLVLASVAIGSVFGGLVVWMGVCMVKQGRRSEITAAFLGSWSDNQCSSIQLQSEKTAGEGGDAA